MKLCPNCNEWFDDDKDICPHCGYRYKADDEKVTSYVDNDIGRVFKAGVRKYDPWIVTLVVLINVTLLLSIIDIFVSDFCWSCYPIIILFAGFFAARLISVRNDKRLLDKGIRRYLLILSVFILFYAIIIKLNTKVGQDLSYMIFYIIPSLYIAYTIAVMIRFFIKKISMINVVMSMLSITGVCLLLALIGAITFKAQGFALAMCLLPFAVSFLIAVNMGLFIFLDLKKKVEKSDGEDGEIKVDYEVLDEDKEDKDGDAEDK